MEKQWPLTAKKDFEYELVKVEEAKTAIISSQFTFEGKILSLFYRCVKWFIQDPDE